MTSLPLLPLPDPICEVNWAITPWIMKWWCIKITRKKITFYTISNSYSDRFCVRGKKDKLFCSVFPVVQSTYNFVLFCTHFYQPYLYRNIIFLFVTSLTIFLLWWMGCRNITVHSELNNLELGHKQTIKPKYYLKTKILLQWTTMTRHNFHSISCIKINRVTKGPLPHPVLKGIYNTTVHFEHV